ncbi:MAG: site-specific integrase [Eubacteriales bacterium]|nr:site-specific integrase [Eubacteriales bacterium]
METALHATETNGRLVVYVEKINEYASQAKAENTVRAYRSDWNHFVRWCNLNDAGPLPASVKTVGAYVTTLAEEGFKVSTITRRVSAISQAHQAAGHASPTQAWPVRTILAGIRRARGSAQEGKAPVLTEDLRQMISTLPTGILGTRDRALLLLGFAGAFRRSELVGLDVADLDFTREGLRVTIRRSKTDQDGRGRLIGIPYGSNPTTCPVRALEDWIEASSIEEGPVFHAINRHGQIQAGRLSDKAVALVVKRAAHAAGLDPANFAGHSLRAGLATSAAAAGVSERAIMNQTGHRSVNMVRRYIREGSLFRDNAAGQVGL